VRACHVITLISWPTTKVIHVIPANAGIQDFLDPDFRRGDGFILRQTLRCMTLGKVRGVILQYWCAWWVENSFCLSGKLS